MVMLAANTQYDWAINTPVAQVAITNQMHYANQHATPRTIAVNDIVQELPLPQDSLLCHGLRNLNNLIDNEAWNGRVLDNLLCHGLRLLNNLFDNVALNGRVFDKLLCHGLRHLNNLLGNDAWNGRVLDNLLCHGLRLLNNLLDNVALNGPLLDTLLCYGLRHLNTATGKVLRVLECHLDSLLHFPHLGHKCCPKS